MELYLLDIFLVLFIVIYLFLSSIFDLKTREVPDFLSYSLIAIALCLRLIFSIISKDFSFVLFGLGGFIVFFIIANLMYYSKQWGGGDAKLLMGLGATIPVYPQSLIQYFNPYLDKIPFLLTLFLNLIVIGAIYALFYSIIIALKHKKQIINEFILIINKKNFRFVRKIIIFTSLGVLIYALMQSNNQTKVLLSLVVFSTLFLFYLIIFLKAAEKSSLIKNVDVKTLTPGDWITHKISKDQNVIYDPKKGYGLTKEQIAKIKSYGIRKVEIKQGIPFVPSFFISVILTLLYGNLVFRIVGL